MRFSKGQEFSVEDFVRCRHIAGSVENDEQEIGFLVAWKATNFSASPTVMLDCFGPRGIHQFEKPHLRGFILPGRAWHGTGLGSIFLASYQ